MLKRIKNAWKLSQIPGIAEADEITLRKSGLDRTVVVARAAESVGDGQAVFFGEGTEEEFKDQENKDKGLLGIFGL